MCVVGGVGGVGGVLHVSVTDTAGGGGWRGGTVKFFKGVEMYDGLEAPPSPVSMAA